MGVFEYVALLVHIFLSPSHQIKQNTQISDVQRGEIPVNRTNVNTFAIPATLPTSLVKTPIPPRQRQFKAQQQLHRLTCYMVGGHGRWSR